MNKNKKILFQKYMRFLFVVVTVLNMSQLETWNINAQDEETVSSASTQVSFEQDNTIMYRVSIRVTGDGEVRYEQNGKHYVIREESVGILLALYESITFNLVPDDGIEVKSILLNGQPLKSRASTYEIILNGSDGNQTLEIAFEEQEDILIKSIQNTISEGQQIVVPNTGVNMSSHMGKTCFISLCISVYLYQKRRSILD